MPEYIEREALDKALTAAAINDENKTATRGQTQSAFCIISLPPTLSQNGNRRHG